MTAKPKTTKDSPEEPEKDDLTRPGKFSLESFLAGRLNPVKSHFVTLDPDRAALIEKLHTEKAGAESILGAAEAEAVGAPKRRMAAKDERRERIRQIDAEVAELTAALEGSWVEVQFRPMTVSERDAVQATDITEAASISALMWSTCAQLRPAGSESEDDWQTLTIPEWTQVIDAIGIPQFAELDKTFGSLTFGGRKVTPDFFGLPSARPTTQSS